MKMWQRAGIAAVLVTATVGIMGPAASAAPMPWETSRVHKPALTQATAITSVGESGTVAIRCAPPCYQ